MNEYIYVIVRNDLTNAQKVVQACHAVAELGKRHSLDETVQFLVALSVENEQELLEVENKLKDNIEFASFRESDMNNSLTAIATVPLKGDIRLFFKDYKLLI